MKIACNQKQVHALNNQFQSAIVMDMKCSATQWAQSVTLLVDLAGLELTFFPLYWINNVCGRWIFYDWMRKKIKLIGHLKKNVCFVCVCVCVRTENILDRPTSQCKRWWAIIAAKQQNYFQIHSIFDSSALARPLWSWWVRVSCHIFCMRNA